MKDFIVCMAILPILIIFMLQIGIDQKNNQITGVIQSATYAAKEEAKQEGCFTPKCSGILKFEQDKNRLSTAKIV